MYRMQDNTSLLKLNVDRNSMGDGWGPTLTAMAQVIASIRNAGIFVYLNMSELSLRCYSSLSIACR